MCNSRWQDCSAVPRTILQQLLARLFNGGWYDFSTLTGIILQLSLARLFNSHLHDSSTVAGTILQQSQARFFLFSMLAELFNNDVHCWRIVPCTRNTTHDPELFYRKSSVDRLWLFHKREWNILETTVINCRPIKVTENWTKNVMLIFCCLENVLSDFYHRYRQV